MPSIALQKKLTFFPSFNTILVSFRILIDGDNTTNENSGSKRAKSTINYGLTLLMSEYLMLFF